MIRTYKEEARHHPKIAVRVDKDTGSVWIHQGDTGVCDNIVWET